MKDLSQDYIINQMLVFPISSCIVIRLVLACLGIHRHMFYFPFHIQRLTIQWCQKRVKRNSFPELNLSWTDTFMLLGISFHTDLETMTELNYNAKITAIEKILQSCRKRRLSLIGKITVIKTLAVPKLVYAMKVLPSPNKGIIDRLNKLFKSFIWKEDKPRIILSQLEQDISNGGLRLTNISFLNNALKISWIPDVIKGNKSLGYIFQNIVNCDKHSIWFLDTCSLQKFLSRVNNSF